MPVSTCTSRSQNIGEVTHVAGRPRPTALLTLPPPMAGNLIQWLTPLSVHGVLLLVNTRFHTSVNSNTTNPDCQLRFHLPDGRPACRLNARALTAVTAPTPPRTPQQTCCQCTPVLCYTRSPQFIPELISSDQLTRPWQPPLRRLFTRFLQFLQRYSCGR